MSTTSDELFSAPPEAQKHELKWVIGPKLLLLFIVGDILGAGVYAVTGTMAGQWAALSGCRSFWPSSSRH